MKSYNTDLLLRRNARAIRSFTTSTKFCGRTYTQADNDAIETALRNTLIWARTFGKSSTVHPMPANYKPFAQVFGEMPKPTPTPEPTKPRTYFEGKQLAELDGVVVLRVSRVHKYRQYCNGKLKDYYQMTYLVRKPDGLIHKEVKRSAKCDIVEAWRERCLELLEQTNAAV